MLHSLYMIFILLLILFVALYIFTYHKKILVIIYETDLNNKRLNKYIKTLKRFGYDYKIIGDYEWKGFGKKIKTLHTFLNTLPPNKIVVISDGRDVFVGKNQSELIHTYTKLALNKILVSTEWACCEETRKMYAPNNIRYVNGSHKYLMNNSQKNVHHWIQQFKTLAFTKTGRKDLKWVNPNAGLYMGQVKDILKMYSLMNIYKDDEDDQSVLSEIILQNQNMFELDYFASIFSNSHMWGSECHYKNTNNEVINTTFNSKPFFFHFPAKHFDCYDKTYAYIT